MWLCESKDLKKMKIITGMHRSGTSLVARLFFEAGADMGDPSTFYRSDKWNPGGYFEQPDIHSINMPLINGLIWKFSYFWLPSTETIMRRAARKSELIHDIANKYNDKVLKETRFCLTIPAWQKYGAKIGKILICIRDPIQVARSIQRRNKISLNMAYSLWLVHNQRLLENSKGIPIWFIYYGNLIDRDRFEEEVIPALQFFNIDISKENLAQIASIIDPKVGCSAESRPDYPEPVKILWQKLLDCHANQFKTPEKR